MFSKQIIKHWTCNCTLWYIHNMIIRTEVEKDLHQRFKVACIQRGQTMQGALLEMVSKYTEDHEKKQAKSKN